VLTNPLIYSAIIALCALAREIVRCHYHHRDITFLMQMTRDPSSLRYLAQLEEARRPWTATRRRAAHDGQEPPSSAPARPQSQPPHQRAPGGLRQAAKAIEGLATKMH
jgi:hypothetical protein